MTHLAKDLEDGQLFNEGEFLLEDLTPESQRNFEDAVRLAGVISAYWAQRGYEIKIEIKQGKYDNADHSLTFFVESDLLNGLPRQRNKVPSKFGRVCQIAEEETGFSLSDVLAGGRSSAMSAARRAYMYHARVAGFSTPWIGRQLKRDHSTVVYQTEQYAKEKGLPPFKKRRPPGRQKAGYVAKRRFRNV